MRTHVTASIALLVILGGSCATESVVETTPPGIAVSATVHAGPTCPVESDPPDPACADRPVAGAHLLILDAVGDEVADVTTTPRGTFTIELQPGDYTLMPQPVEGLLGTAGPQPFTVGDDPVELDVAYDTGIR
jgi:hypothetical protein